MKNSTKVILVIVFILVLFNNVDFGSLNKPKEFSIDKERSEGYVAYIVNSEDQNNQDEETRKCECNGTKQITHGDGHKTPCPCKEGECKCEKEFKDIINEPAVEETKTEEINNDKKKDEPVNNNNKSQQGNVYRLFRFRK